MGYWNYRVIKEKKEGRSVYSIKDVYYDSEGNITAYGTEPVILEELSLRELKELLKYCKNALKKKVVKGFKKTF